MKVVAEINKNNTIRIKVEKILTEGVSITRDIR
jgi:hypothetical protein